MAMKTTATRKATGSGRPRVVKKATPRKTNLAKVAAPDATARRTPVAAEPASVIGSTASELLAITPQKLVRDSFTMPKNEYALLEALKGRLLLMSQATKKGELIRAGIVTLATLSDDALLKAVARVPSLKAGRPKKIKGPEKGDRKKS